MYSREIIDHLAASLGSDRITLYVNEWGATDWRPPPGVGVRQISSSRLWTHARLSREMLQAPPDVLFVPAHSLPLWSPAASVVTVHDLGYRRLPGAHGLAARLYRLWSTRLSVRAATRIIAVSEATRRDLVELEGVPLDRIQVVHHGVDPSLRPVDDPTTIRAAQDAYGLPSKYFLYLGTLQPRKNLERLVRAHRHVVNSDPDAPALVLAGQVGWLAEPILAEARRGSSAQHVKVLGYVDRAHLAAILSGAVAFVYPSLYEGFGMPVLEAMACGCPVMTSTSSSLPEVAGDAALLVDPLDETAIAEVLARLWRDADLRASLRARGFERVKQFTWARAARETMAVLREAADVV
jgi:glycosyltransferase involved in cell wall biosynthesis